MQMHAEDLQEVSTTKYFECSFHFGESVYTSTQKGQWNRVLAGMPVAHLILSIIEAFVHVNTIKYLESRD
jgi:hypothetical protein